MSKKQEKVRKVIPQWCIEYAHISPAQDEMDTTAQYLVDHPDLSCLPNAAACATISLLCRDLGTGDRIFQDTDIAALTLRNKHIIADVLAAMPDSKKVLAVMTAACIPLVKTSTRKKTK